VAKVVDFGLVKDRDGAAGDGNLSLSAIGSITGTPLYLSPEAIRDPTSVDARSDLYALGAVAYFLLTGHPVFAATSVVELCALHLTAAPMQPEERLGRPLPGPLTALVMRCLAKKPDERPATAADLRAALLASGVDSWNEPEAASWWRCNGEAVQGRRCHASVAPHAATVAIDLERRRAPAHPVVDV
jgi:serine/threonine-protein kinase